MSKLTSFQTAYITTALWSTTDNATDQGGEPLDKNFSLDDIHPDTLAAMCKDCDAFLEENSDDIGYKKASAGHDFWLTRNRHGAGFWDGDWSKEAGERLTKASHAYGSVDLYIGDDDMIHQA